MSYQNLKVEEAEIWQAIKTLLMPFSLFLAWIKVAAAIFLIYNGGPLVWPIASVATLVIVLAFVGLIRFQNTYRAKEVMANRSGNDDNMTAPGESTDI